MLSCSGLKAREHPQDNSEKGEGTRDARLEKKRGGGSLRSAAPRAPGPPWETQRVGGERRRRRRFLFSSS